MAEDPKIKTVVVDTFTAFQKNDVLTKWEKGKATQDDWKDYGVDIVVFVKKLTEMGVTVVGVVGYEGTGKSFGMKYLPTKTNVWFNADRKNATWKGGKEEYGTITAPSRYMKLPKSYDEVLNTIKAIKEQGLLDEEPVAFLLGHIEDYKSVNGQQRQRLKTLGKLANKMNVEDMFSMCYYTEVQREGLKTTYKFRTQNSGFDNCRSLEAQHDSYTIDNNYQTVIEAIENY